MKNNRYRIKSQSLGISLTAFDHGYRSASVETDDGVHYLPREIFLLANTKSEVLPALHLIKKVFEGSLENIHLFSK